MGGNGKNAEIYKLNITYYHENGNMRIEGATKDEKFACWLLDKAKAEIIKDHQRRKLKIVQPGGIIKFARNRR